MTRASKPMKTIAEWKAAFLPDSDPDEILREETPNLTLLTQAAAMQAVQEVRGVPAKRRQSATRQR